MKTVLLLLVFAAVAFANEAVGSNEAHESPTASKADMDAFPPDDNTPYDPTQHAKDEMKKMDFNKDGKVDVQEIAKYMKAEFYTPEVLAESDEKMTPEQVDEKVQEDAREYLGEMDADKDGIVTEAEIVKHYIDDSTGHIDDVTHETALPDDDTPDHEPEEPEITDTPGPEDMVPEDQPEETATADSA